MLLSLLLMLSTLGEAQEAFERKDFSKAAQAYHEVLTQEPQNHEALLGRARALAYSGQHEAAAEAYTTLLSYFPQDSDARLGRGRVLAWLKRYAESESDLLSALQQQNDVSDVWEALFDLYFWSNNPKIDAHLDAWQNAFINSPTPWLAQARLEISRRQFAQARQSISEARSRQADPDTLNRLLTQLNRAPGAQPWEALVQYDFQPFLGGTQAPWHTFTSGLRYTHERGSVGIQAQQATRFSFADQALTLDIWNDLWPGAYGNARILGTYDPEILPSWDILGEVFQSFWDIWELSGSYRLMQYPTGGVHFGQLGLGSYWENWYFRATPMMFFAPEGPGASLTLWARYFLDTTDNYIELRTGLGRRLVTVDAGPRIEGQTNAFGIISSQYFFTPQLGLYGSLSYNYDEAFPAQLGLSIGSKYRW